MAEELHERVRKEFWGYSNEEQLNAKDLHSIKYQVLRMFSSTFIMIEFMLKLLCSYLLQSCFFVVYNLC